MGVYLDVGAFFAFCDLLFFKTKKEATVVAATAIPQMM